MSTEREIAHVYLGLPDEFKERVVWVAQDYRTNQLSHEPGGSDVVVEYQTGEVFGYDRIKFPANYIMAIFSQDFYRENQHQGERLRVMQQRIRALFARRYRNEVDHGTVPFQKIWTHEDDQLPWALLETFNPPRHRFPF